MLLALQRLDLLGLCLDGLVGSGLFGLKGLDGRFQLGNTGGEFFLGRGQAGFHSGLLRLKDLGLVLLRLQISSEGFDISSLCCGLLLGSRELLFEVGGKCLGDLELGSKTGLLLLDGAFVGLELSLLLLKGSNASLILITRRRHFRFQTFDLGIGGRYFLGGRGKR